MYCSVRGNVFANVLCRFFNACPPVVKSHSEWELSILKSFTWGLYFFLTPIKLMFKLFKQMVPAN